MARISSGQKPNYSRWPNSNCIACKAEPGKPRYGLYLCPACDDRIFIKPYGGYSADKDECVDSINLRADHTNTPYDELSVIYRFAHNDTLISAKKGTLSFPLLTIPGIQPMTEEWIAKLPTRLKLWLVFS